MSMTDQLAQVARKRDIFHLCITPEGTRSRTEEWKKRVLLYRLEGRAAYFIVWN